MKYIIENIKARIYCIPYNRREEKFEKDKSDDCWYYNGKLYYGNRWFVFFESASNVYFKDSPNNPINQKKS